MSEPDGFEVRTVVHLIRPWGEPVSDLEDLHAAVAAAPAEVLFYHTLQVQLRDPAASELPIDDVSAWVGGVIQDFETAERISYSVQNESGSADQVRNAMLTVLDSLALSERSSRRAPAECVLQLLVAESIPVPIGLTARDGEQLVTALTSADPGIWFYHVIEQPWFGHGAFPLAEWLQAVREARLAGWVRESASPGHPLERSRERLRRRWRRSRLARRIAEAEAVPEDERRRVGREVVARLLKRATSPGNEP